MGIELREGDSPIQATVKAVQIFKTQAEYEAGKAEGTLNPLDQRAYQKLADIYGHTTTKLTTVLNEHVEAMTDAGYDFVQDDLDEALMKKPETDIITPAHTTKT